MKMMKRVIQYMLIIFSFCGISCSNFLDLKPDQKMAVPQTLEHCELLLNDYTTMNTGYPTLGVIAADDYYLNANDFNSLAIFDEQQTYIWSANILSLNTQWQNPYKTGYLSNQILEITNKLNPQSDELNYNKVRGGAHFFRAFAFHQVATAFTLPYQRSNANEEFL